jgi:ATP-dependent Clp protease ATP-binding subunit ClpC
MNPFSVHENIWRDPEYRFFQALLADTLFPLHIRKWVSRIAILIVVFHLIVGFGPFLLEKISLQGPTEITPIGEKVVVDTLSKTVGKVPDFATIPEFFPFVGGIALPLSPETPRGNALFLFALSVWFIAKMFSWFRNSYYYLVEGKLERGETGAQTAYTTQNYEVCVVYWETRHGDLLKSFVTSVYGKMILRRCGIADDIASQYLSQRKNIIDFNQHTEQVKGTFTLLELSKLLVTIDADFYQFLFELGIRERELAGAAEWIERDLKRQKQRARWWGKVNLGQSSSIGADFAYGGAYVLGKYGSDLTRRAISGGSNFRFVYGNEQIKQLEIVLSRSKEANAILVGEEGTGKMDVILDFARDIMNGYTNPALKHKRVMAFDTKSLISNSRSKQELETELVRIFNDSVSAGNIILVIDDLPGFIQGGLSLDSDVMALINPYLSGDAIQVIATADNGRFHQFIEPNNAIMQRFEKVMLTEPEEEALIRVLEEVAEVTERRNPVYFSYPAITEIIKSAENYFSDGIMPDKAIDLMVEITPTVLSKGGHLVKKMDVLEFVREKTNIPVGNIDEEERERLLNLETLLKQLVTGQEKALEIVANAMRRSRAGVRSQNRPIGAFLFLGPTGVGKTETAKALATVFFGSEEAMSRIDMSEYQGDDGLSRMIGSLEGQKGTLPVMLKEQPYGVLLLDEFEKTNPKVLDIFLQIFDEGLFHDAQGKKINARNTIFIATSNAGAQLIREAIQQGRNLDEVQKDIIDQIIAQGKLKPELINRFDGVILFHPLNEENYRAIAKLMLGKLQKRLRDKSINLVINDVLIGAVMHFGVDPEFGARPMTRAIQDVVEQKVAEKIIKGQLNQGTTLEFVEADFPEVYTQGAVSTDVP